MGVPNKGIYVLFGSMLESSQFKKLPIMICLLSLLSTLRLGVFSLVGVGDVVFGYGSGRMDGFVLGSSETRRLFRGETNQVTAKFPSMVSYI